MKKNMEKLLVVFLLAVVLFTTVAAATFTAHCKAMSWQINTTPTVVRMQVTYQCTLIANPLIGYTFTDYAELPMTFDR